MSERVLLEMLSDGEFHSGEELGERLSISRTAIWKQLKKLEALGIHVESIKGKGYRLPGGISLLNEKDILVAIGDTGNQLISKLEIESVIESTNAQALSYAQENGGYPYVCTTERQTGGRGRRGKAWFSPYGQNLYFSLTWEFVNGASALEGLSLAVGVVVADVLAELGAPNCQLKWPNDILYDGKKLSGILLEITGDAAGPCQVVVGVGLNVSMTASTESIDQPWTDLQQVLEERPDRNHILGRLVAALLKLLSTYEFDGFTTYRERFSLRDMHQGKPVMLRLGERLVLGDAVGIDTNGALLVDTDAGRQVFNGGEVSLRVLSDT